SFYTGTAETDWSWSPLLADVNNDGHRDLLVTNGYPRDVTDHDFMVFRSRSANIASKQTLIDQIPQIKIPNYAFENKGQLHFENSSANWGLGDASFSNGAVCLDLDNDGDLDYVINNINDPAFLYENTSRSTKENTNTHYLSIRFKGDDKNRWGIGAIATIYYGKERQLYENNPYRGYLSTADTRAFFGLGNISTIDSIRIIWPDASTQLLTGVKADQEMIADKKNAAGIYSWQGAGGASDPLFTIITKASGVQYVHKEMDYIDFDRERLLPHKLSQYGPALAVADVDGNGLDDLLVGGGGEYPARLLLQQQGGRFTDQPMPGATGMDIRKPLQAGLLFFDADGDGDADLYCASGGNEFPANTKNYADQLFINDGKGHFSFDTSGALPDNYTSKSCVKAADIDNDGDLDLFIGGRCLPGRYPSGVSSYIYRNDGSNGKPKFTDITSQAAKELLRPSMVCDALFTDFNNDGLTDFITAAEWGPLRFFKNNGGSFVEITQQTGIGNELGWWNSIAAADIDNDGDLDYIVGNLGQNSFFRASNNYPLRMYAKDFDGNGSVDAIITSYFKDVDGVKKEFTAFNRDDIVGQLPGLRRKFPTYKEFANAGFAQLFTAEQMKGADTLQANNLASCVVMNLGNGKFSMEPLPAMAQMAPLYGLLADDVDNDGNLDLVLNGNDFGNEVTNGRYDALNGLLLLGDGKGHFAAQTPAHAGLCIPGDGKALVKLNTDSGYLLAASENRGPLRLFKSRRNLQMIPLKKEERWAVVTLKNGKSRREEFYYGNSFYSQSARSVAVGPEVSNIRFGNEKGVTRQLYY
ncbi:MAG TPA: FG-GAP-like repeat-containing protein, partial [Chitinophagaceae bacterium]|nr:FG-GAP-like repeat-containing protein [Chitinophagaceae bacterium]